MKNLENPEAMSPAEKKMSLEIKDLEHKCKWLQRNLTFTPFISAIFATLATIATFLGGGYLFYEEQKRQAALTYNTPVWKNHVKVYFDTVDVVSRIATSPPKSQLRKDEEQKFLQLFHGSLVLVEDDDLRQLKVDFANCLQGVVEICTTELDKDTHLKELSQSFANIARTSLERKGKAELNMGSIFNQTNQPTESDTNK